MPEETPLDARLADQPADEYEGESLAAQLQNPVADLISLPIQLNWDTGIGPDEDADRLTVNIQPVIPINLTDDWNVISRTIVPVVYADGPAPGISSAFGVGDTLQSFFFSPREKLGGWILGAGPAALLPTGADDLFRSKQLALGPTLVALRQDRLGEGVLTYGVLANHLWNVAGSNDTPTVNASFLQPFVSYTFPTATSLTLNSETTYDWTREDWSVPLNLSVSQVMRIGSQPISFQIGGRWYPETFDDGPEWGLRFAVTFLFPK